jgi:hypothetical protein
MRFFWRSAAFSCSTCLRGVLLLELLEAIEQVVYVGEASRSGLLAATRSVTSVLNCASRSR